MDAQEKTPSAEQGDQGQSANEKAQLKIATLKAVRQALMRRLENNERFRAGTIDPDRVCDLSRSIGADKARLVHVQKLIERIEREGLAEKCATCNGKGWVLVHDAPDPDCGYPGGTWQDTCPECQGVTDREVQWVRDEFGSEVA